MAKQWPDTAEDWVVLLQTEEISRETRLAFEHWSKASPDNADAYARVLGVWKAVGTHAYAPEFDELRARTDALFPKAKARSVRQSFKPWLAVTVAAALVVLGVFTATGRRWESDFQSLQGETRHMVLPDGSEVDVSSNTRLSFKFGVFGREVWLDHGEAYFSVVHDWTRPFVVLVGNDRIKDIGTRFDVSTDRDAFQVAVAEGTVQVDIAPGKGAAAVSRRINTGDRMDVAASGGITVNKTNASSVASWRYGWLVYEHTALKWVVSQVNRFNAQKFVIADPKLEELPFAGRMRIGDTEQLLASVQAIYGIQAKPVGDHIELYLPHGR